MAAANAAEATLSRVMPGVMRVRVPLPFPPTEVNAWLLDDGEGWTLVDSGVDDAATRALFDRVLADPALAGRPVSRLVATHFHPDHIGLAGWLAERTGADLHMSRVEFMQAHLLMREDPAAAIAQLVAFYALCAAPQDFLDHLPRRGMLFPRWVGPLPRRFVRIAPGEQVAMAGTSWRVIAGEGHAPEMLCFHSAERGVLIAADQILPRISPHIGAHPVEPLTDPLGDYLRTLTPFEALPEGTLVLPSHGEPFHGLHSRIDALRAHHAERLERLVDFCASPRTVMDTTAVLFRALPQEQIGFGLGEALAHLHHLVLRGDLRRHEEAGHWLFARN